LAELGTLKTPDADEGISNAAFEFLRNAPEPELDSLPPTEVQQLAESRQKARANKDFAKSDQLRDQINALGWDLRDTSNGQELVKKD